MKLCRQARAGYLRLRPGAISPESVDRARVRGSFPGRVAGALMALCLVAAPAGRAWSSSASGPGATASRALPNAPQPQTPGRIIGTVHQPAGAAVAGALVTLTGTNPEVHRTARTNRRGRFVFRGLAAGSYTVSVSGPGFEPVSPAQVVLGAGEMYRLPVTATPLPKVSATVVVTATPVQIAKAQVKVEEEQRVLAVIPNFATSFVWNAQPLTPGLKFRLELRTLIDPFTIGTDAALAGVEQWHNTFPGYGGGWQGYGKRFGAILADGFDARMIGNALLASVFHQDPRYFYHGGPHVGRRLFYALRETVMCRGNDERQQFCYTRLTGDFGAAGIANVYHAPGDRGFGITARDGLVIPGTDAAENLMREFVSKALTSHKPPGAKGKPQKH
jgi:hypothetical protein